MLGAGGETVQRNAQNGNRVRGNGMKIKEWNKIETVFTDKYGWEPGLKKMRRVRNTTSFKSCIIDFSPKEDDILRKSLRKAYSEKATQEGLQ
tara:strand:- start:167 stop:442 length:276 start_codon:yes stop_codon:yes gene_type:complete